LRPSSAKAGCVGCFVGAAILLRADAARQNAGYRAFYQAQGEEGELALQLIANGWPILYCPSVPAHHRRSAMNRNSLARWRRGLGDDIGTLVLRMPARRLLVEVGSWLLVGVCDAVRLVRVGYMRVMVELTCDLHP